MNEPHPPPTATGTLGVARLNALDVPEASHVLHTCCGSHRWVERMIAALPFDAADAIFIIDPRGYLVLRYPAKPDIRGLFKDLSRLLVASRIG